MRPFHFLSILPKPRFSAASDASSISLVVGGGGDGGSLTVGDAAMATTSTAMISSTSSGPPPYRHRQGWVPRSLQVCSFPLIQCFFLIIFSI
jgi:hypothetical protein